MRVRRAMATAVLTATMAACGHGATSTQPRDLTAYVLSAATKTTEAHTARVAMTITVRAGGAQPDTSTASGAVDFGEHRATLEQTIGGLKQTVVLFGTVAYIRFPPSIASHLPPGKTWVRVDFQRLAEEKGFDFQGFQQTGSSDPAQSLRYLNGVSSDVTDIGTEPVRGVDTHHYRFTIDFRKAAQHDPDNAANYEQLERLYGITSMPMDAWIDADGRVRRMSFAFTIPASALATPGATDLHMTQQIEYFDFGVAVNVSEPSASEVVDLQDLQDASASS